MRLVDDGTISGKIAKDVFERMLALGRGRRPPSCSARGSRRSPTPARSRRIVDQVIAANPKAVADCKAGKTAAAKALVGQVMKASGGKANPAMVNRLVQEKLSQDLTARGYNRKRPS